MDNMKRLNRECPSFDGTKVSAFILGIGNYWEHLEATRKTVADPATAASKRVQLLVSSILDPATKKEIRETSFVEKNDWDGLCDWMRARWASTDDRVTLATLKELTTQGLSVKDFISQFGYAMERMSRLYRPSEFDVMDTYLLGLGPQLAWQAMRELEAKELVLEAAQKGKYIDNGMPSEWKVLHRP
jgi:hypothetical protein